jgi:hypothetical protein
MLALVGSGEYLPDVDPIDITLIERLTEPAKVVCFPLQPDVREMQSSIRGCKKGLIILRGWGWR